jgi:hypothetical protein
VRVSDRPDTLTTRREAIDKLRLASASSMVRNSPEGGFISGTRLSWSELGRRLEEKLTTEEILAIRCWIGP